MLFPVVRYAGLHPWQVIVRTDAGDPPVVPYHDLRTVARAAGLVLDPPTNDTVRAVTEASLGEPAHPRAAARHRRGERPAHHRGGRGGAHDQPPGQPGADRPGAPRAGSARLGARRDRPRSHPARQRARPARPAGRGRPRPRRRTAPRLGGGRSRRARRGRRRGACAGTPSTRPWCPRRCSGTHRCCSLLGGRAA
nr:WcbI family polysaccharide biosynthesis putative acetyltransferase [Angustibacter aerolatus]